MGELLLNVAYGKMVHSSLPEILSWNKEAIDLVNYAFTSIWMVDIFHFCLFQPYSLHGKRLIVQQYALSQVGFLAPVSSKLSLKASIAYLTGFIGE